MARDRATPRGQAVARRGASSRVGVISDTHGLLRPEAMRALRGVDLIVHAGDIGSPDVLEELRTVARVVAVRGNNDREAWSRAIPERAEIVVAGVRVLVIHDVNELRGGPPGSGVRVVVAGHSHRPAIAERDGVLYLNPGSAGPRRFTLPVSVALLTVRNRRPRARLMTLDVEAVRLSAPRTPGVSSRAQ